MKKLLLLIFMLSCISFSQDMLKTFNNTSAITADSINIGFTPVRIIIYNDATATDTLYMSNSSSFPANSTIKRVGQTYCDLNLKWQIFYIKFGYTATASKKYRVEAIQ